MCRSVSGEGALALSCEFPEVETIRDRLRREVGATGAANWSCNEASTQVDARVLANMRARMRARVHTPT